MLDQLNLLTLLVHPSEKVVPTPEALKPLKGIIPPLDGGVGLADDLVVGHRPGFYEALKLVEVGT